MDGKICLLVDSRVPSARATATWLGSFVTLRCTPRDKHWPLRREARVGALRALGTRGRSISLLFPAGVMVPCPKLLTEPYTRSYMRLLSRGFSLQCYTAILLTLK